VAIQWALPPNASPQSPAEPRAGTAGDFDRSAATEITRILLIEDNRGDADLVHEHFEDTALDVDLIVAPRLGAGLALLDRKEVDCVLLDLGLPDARGEESVRRLRERAPDVPLVVLTGLGDVVVAQRCVQLGAQEFLEKGRLDARTLAQAVQLAMLRVSEGRARRELRQADRLRAVGMLAAGIAHEINNPLTYLEVNLEHVRERLSAPEPGQPPLDAVDECRDGVRRISRIVRRLNSFARADDDTQGEVSLVDVVRDARRLTEHRWRRLCRYEEALEPVPPLRGYPGQITQVVVNLLVNATHAIEEGAGSVIRVRTRRDGDAVEVVVEDDGRGMTERELARAFDPFFTTKSRHRGTGLGLSLCREIARRHGGTLDATSALGSGAAFTLRLPIAKGPSEAPAPVERARAAPSRLRVLVVDDEPIIRRSISRLLKTLHDVTTAESGREAIAILSEGTPFDALLCDLTMADGDGESVYHWVRRNRPELEPRFVLMSGGARQDQIDRLPDVRRLAKPFRPRQLLSLLADLQPDGDAQ